MVEDEGVHFEIVLPASGIPVLGRTPNRLIACAYKALSYGACCQPPGETRGAGQAGENRAGRGRARGLVPRPHRGPARVVPPVQ